MQDGEPQFEWILAENVRNDAVKMAR